MRHNAESITQLIDARHEAIVSEADRPPESIL